ncbi:hypothetical protein JTB14_027795 [Gonioctena quinquepunctata]|nr:hypothetical protein JTB14_027795 [Gonioctena quinquepunctata]
MPREASKVRGWEKERRNRLNEGFASLAKVLPTYDPSVNLSKIAILTKATCAIEQLQNELNKIISPNASDKSTKDDIVKKLQKRIKKLLVRNEQLNNLLRDAEISVPTVVGTVRKFPRKLPWSKRISPDQAKIFQKNEMEKENISSKLVQGQKKKMSVSKANDGLNRPCFFIENPSTTTTKSKINKSGSQKTPVINTTFPFINPTIPYLGPGTLILANGTVMPILSQPQVVVPQSVKIPNVNELNIPKHLQANNQTPIKKNGLSEGKKHIAIRPKHCVTKTNQVNKVPIPALTSRYANSYFFINGTVTNRICERGKNKVLQRGKRKALSLERKAVKRKNDDNTDCIPKKNKINDSVFKNATDAAEIEFEASQNNHLTVSKTSDTTKKATGTSDTTSTIINTSPETVSSESKPSVDEKTVPRLNLAENCVVKSLSVGRFMIKHLNPIKVMI